MARAACAVVRADADDGGGAGELHAAAIKRVWHIHARSMLDLPFRLNSSKRFQLFPLLSEAGYRSIKCWEWAGLTLTTAGVMASFTLTARDAFANLRDTLHDEAYG